MNTLLIFLKELADATRLTIVGLLAQSPRSGDELAASLGLKASTISHHLTRLQKAGLVSVTAQQYYHVYTLEPTALAQLRALLTPEQLASAVAQQGSVDDNAYRQQILTRWVASDRLQGLPTPIKQRTVVLQWLAAKFTQDQRYTPSQVDDLLNRWCRWQHGQRMDITTVTRALVDAKQLDRTRDGQWYWRADSPLVQGVENFSPERLPPADTAALHVPLPISPLRKLVQLAMRIKANHPLAAAEVDELLAQHDVEGTEVTTLRSALVTEGLLQQDESDYYLRPMIGPDHPATARLREEALARLT